MRKKLFSTLSALLALMLLTSTVIAAAKLRDVSFNVGPGGNLTMRGTATGVGNREAVARLEASGQAEVSCYNRDGGLEPDQGYTIDVKGASFGGFDGKGIQVAIIDSGIAYDNECPNTNWTAHIDFVYWDSATITVIDLETGEALVRQDNTCVTTRDPETITCTPIN